MNSGVEPIAFAATTNNFKINLLVGNDTTPPTTPVLQSVIPVTSSQINLLWLPSTDDFLLSGYRVYRDGVPIATTTLTSFSDSGLTPSTLYSYTVDAFDSFYNVSTTSNALATSTLALPTPTPPQTVKRQSGGQIYVQNFTVIPFTTRVALTWQTPQLSRYIVQWGRTTSYEGGTVSSNLFGQQHQVEIRELEPGTVYYYSVIGINTAGVARVLSIGTFTTLATTITTLPVSVRDFRATVEGTDAVLSWRTGELPVGSVVRIVRSHLAYPTSLTDGALVYEGRGEAVRDVKALLVRSPQYYTAFVIAKDGTVSSGALALAGLEPQELPTPTDTDPVIETGEPDILLAPAVSIIQAGMRTTFDNLDPLLANMPYLISIQVSAVKPGIKSIIASVQNPTDQRNVSSYLLKLNKIGDAYEAFIPAPLVTGQARISVEVFDYSAQSVRQITTTIRFITTDTLAVIFPDMLFKTPFWVFGIVGGGIFLGLLVWWWRLLRRPSEDNR